MNETNEKNKGGLRPGTLLQAGKYRIIRYISQGGFGCTYEAEHTMLKTRVAIKEFFVSDFCNRQNETGIISVGVSSKVQMVERLRGKFLDEAIAQHRMSHPNIVRVIDVFEENSTAYYVMDYIEGRSLETLLNERKAPLSEQEAVGYIRQVADALDYVHSNRRLHLDIKPGNIMIDRSGKAILIDFGASKQYDEQGDNKSTVTGFTRSYAPLEQIGGNLKVFSPATDIFSLGSTLYRLLTGETPADSISRLGGEQLKPLPAGITEPTRRAIEQSMKVMLTERPQSIADFLSLLDAPAATAPDAPAPAPAAPEVTEIIPAPSNPVKTENSVSTSETTILVSQNAEINHNGGEPPQSPLPPEYSEEYFDEEEYEIIQKRKKRRSIIIALSVIILGLITFFGIVAYNGYKQDEKTSKNILAGQEYINKLVQQDTAVYKVMFNDYGHEFFYYKITKMGTGPMIDDVKSNDFVVRTIDGAEKYAGREVDRSIIGPLLPLPGGTEVTIWCFSGDLNLGIELCELNVIEYGSLLVFEIKIDNPDEAPGSSHEASISTTDNPDKTSGVSDKASTSTTDNPDKISGTNHEASTSTTDNPDKTSGSAYEAPVSKTDDSDKTYESVEQDPIFPGGQTALLQYISSHISYPSVAQKNGIQGRVVVQFVVTKTGSIGQVKVVRSKDPDLDREAVRVIKSLPKFTPGMMNGHPVNCWYTIPIQFKLQD